MTLGVVCPGQGAQSPAMFALLDGHLAEASAFRACERVLGRDVAAIAAAGDAFLQQNAIAQPLLCAYRLTVWSLLREVLPPPRAFAGYRAGELATYGCAGALSPAPLAGRRNPVGPPPPRLTALPGQPVSAGRRRAGGLRRSASRPGGGRGRRAAARRRRALPAACGQALRR